MASSIVGQASCRNETRCEELTQSILGRILDTDSHEMHPARVWTREYGEEFEPIAKFFLETQAEQVANSFSVPVYEDDAPISANTINDYWTTGCGAPGAFDMDRRLDVLDLTGIDRSLIFGSVMAVIGTQFASDGGQFLKRRQGSMPFEDPFDYGVSMVRAHNDWCIRVATKSPRLRPVAAILTRTLEEAIAETKRVVAGGVRAVTLPSGTPIGGKAPAHPDNDELWHFLADNDIPALLHIGSETGFLREASGWANAPQFAPNNSVPTEVPTDPFSIATCSLSAQTYVTNLVLGAVFERVPNLRFGIVEFGAQWVGATATNMDMWASQFKRRLSGVLSMKPSEYFARNIRVAAFSFEPVDLYFDRYPEVGDVFCFSSDYPHFEGGKDPVNVTAERLARHGEIIFEKFYVTNPELILPA